MKHILLSAALSISALAAMGQTDKTVDSKITNVTVFLNKAQVTRYVRTQVDGGKTNLIITGLTSQLDPQSIQVTGKGGIVILGISHQQNFLNEFNIPRPLKALKDSIESLQKEVALIQSQKEILNREEQMILSNQKIGGANQNLTVVELKGMADFFRSRMSDIVASRMKADEKIKRGNERIIKLQQQYNSQNELYARNTSEIVVSVSAEATTSVGLEVNYVVANAGWNAIYDLRAIDTKHPIHLDYKANVFQNTGEEWNNVKLKLSTANPSLGGLKPELVAWYLNFYEPLRYSLAGKASGVRMEAKSMAAPPAMAELDSKKEDLAPSQTTSDFVTTVQTSLNTEFDISLPYTVSSAAKPTVVDIRSYDPAADYIYSAAPKLDHDAFLLARATGWEDYSLLPGEANIFFEGTFVGKTYIDPNNIRDTLALSLGRDKRIVVKREKLKELTSRKMIGTNQRESSAWEISVRNTKNEPVKIIVEDQVPVSQNSQIEVTVIDVANAKYNKDSGKLTWEISLQPNETKKWVFKYEIKYPRDKQVSGL